MTSSEESAGGTRRFKLVKLLGQGSAGTIWLAFDPREQRLVALKLLSDDAALRSPNARERFWREVRILKDVRHPNLVRFYGHGTVDDRPYFAMEYVRGQSLQDRLARGSVSVFTALRAVYGVARGLDYVHRLGIVHRDVKPSNILIEEDKDGRGTPRLVDFGLARCRAERDLAITGSGVAVGTPRYASPEQARGSSRDADARSDVYSLGLVLATTITHAPPPAPRELDHYRTRFERDILPDLARLAPAAVVDVCRTACAFDPRLRYPTARELAREIRGILRESSQRLRCA